METAAAGDDSDEGGQNMTAKFDITNELAELENDLEFLRFIQSDEINNVEQFVMVSFEFEFSVPLTLLWAIFVNTL